MTENHLLLDTCSYYRLASFFENELFYFIINLESKKFDIKTHQDVINEYRGQRRLKEKYSVYDVTNINSANILSVKSIDDFSLNNAFNIIHKYSSIKKYDPPISIIDKRCLAIQMCSQGNIICITDDSNMRDLANICSLKVYSTVDIIYWLNKEKYIGLEDNITFMQHLISIDDWLSPYFDDKFKKYGLLKSK